ncbi:MAG TPA: uroporphyrinogen decarboxylase family protein [Clostridia bacterium]|nr:uroporphyrinogen decarboxylase family protein [Clostridia bacterium]
MAAQLNTRLRFVRTLTGQEVDRVPFMRVFGGTNHALPSWLEKRPNLSRYMDQLIGFEGTYRGWAIVPANYNLCGLPEDICIEDRGSVRIYRNGIGEIRTWSKDSDYHSGVIEYALKTADDWEKIRPYVVCDVEKRIPRDIDELAEIYKNRDYPLQLTCGGVYGFIRRLAGDENLGYMFYDSPDRVKEIITEYINMLLELWERLCDKIRFDLIESWEDMAYKCGSIISPEHFNEFLAPHYRTIRAFADAHDIPILLVDSDGNTDLLAEWMYAAGVNALYPFESLAGCNPANVRKKLPGMGGIGGLNKDCMAYGKKAMDEELEKAEALIKLGRFIPGPDHMVLSNVTFENYRYFMSRLKDIVMNTKPNQ